MFAEPSPLVCALKNHASERVRSFGKIQPFLNTRASVGTVSGDNGMCSEARSMDSMKSGISPITYQHRRNAGARSQDGAVQPHADESKAP